MNADADLNGADVVLICDGTNWLIAPGGGGGALDDLSDAATYYSSSSMYIGQNAGANVGSSGIGNVYLGVAAGQSGASGALNTYIGNNAGRDGVGTNNVAVGNAALIFSTAPGNAYNVAIGDFALGGSAGLSTGRYNTAVGKNAGAGVTTGEANSLFGMFSGSALQGGQYNTLLGYQAGDVLVSGSKNIIIGYTVDPSSSGATNELNIGNAIYGTGIIDGATRRIGIGAPAPGTTLDVNGSFGLSADLSPVSIGASQNNYAPAGHDTASVLRLTASAAYNITGLAGGVDGRILTLVNIGANTITLVDESASSTAANRFALAGNVALATDQSAVLLYDSTSSRWRVMAVYGAGGAASAGGSDRLIQFNNAGSLDGVPVFNYTTGGLLSFWRDRTDTAGTTINSSLFMTNLTPTANQTAGSVTRGLSGQAYVTNTNTFQVRQLQGLHGYADNRGTGAVERLGGTSGYSANVGAATVTHQHGLYGGVEITTGTVTDMYGVLANSFLTGGNVTNLYGILIDMDNASATVTSRYGLFITTPDGSAANDWGIYQSGTQSNWLGGGLRMADSRALGWNDDSVRVRGDTTVSSLEFYTNNTPRVTIDTNGISMGTAFRMTASLSPPTITANQNNYNPVNLSTASVLRLDASGAFNLTGLQGGSNGRILTLLNVGTNTITLKAEDASSTAANRFDIGSDIAIAADQAAVLMYDSTSSRWRAMARPGGGSTEDYQVFTANGTWTKPAGVNNCDIEMWGGGGGGGGVATNNHRSGGGGGGAYFKATVRASALGATEPVTVGTGGAGGTTAGTAGTAGSFSLFAGFIVYGGGGGAAGSGATSGGGGGGSVLGYGSNGSGVNGGQGAAPNYNNTEYHNGLGGGSGGGDNFDANGGMSIYGGGGGGQGDATGSNGGGTSVYGGGGGGGGSSVSRQGGTSPYGGNGGSSGSNATGAAGTAPGGGGGGTANTAATARAGGAGARGEVRVRCW